MDPNLRSALEKLEAARGLVNEAVSALSTVDEFALQRSELRRLHDNLKDSWYAIAAHRLRQSDGDPIEGFSNSPPDTPPIFRR